MNQTTARPPNFRGRVRVRSGVWSIALVLTLSSDTHWRGNVSRSRPWSLVDVVAKVSDSKGPNRPSSWRSPYMCVHFVIDATSPNLITCFIQGSTEFTKRSIPLTVQTTPPHCGKAPPSNHLPSLGLLQVLLPQTRVKLFHMRHKLSRGYQLPMQE